MIHVAHSNAVYYYHYDGLGSVVALSNSSGNSSYSYEYSAYGQVAASDPNFTANPYLFTGRRFDYETGLYYYRARYYNPYIGRFLQTDPVGYGAGMNLYAYCLNNPLCLTDPFGCDPCDPCDPCDSCDPCDVISESSVAIPGGTGAIAVAVSSTMFALPHSLSDEGMIEWAKYQELVKLQPKTITQSLWQRFWSALKVRKHIPHSIIKHTANHIFGTNLAKHNMASFLASFGGDPAKATKAIYGAAQTLMRTQAYVLSEKGYYWGRVIINEHTVTMRGFIIDGVFRVGTAYIEK